MISPIDIYSVIKYGELFSVKIGSSESELLDLLNNEDIEKISTCSGSDCLKMILWENIEFHVFDGMIISIIIKIQKSRSKQTFFIVDANQKISYRSTLEKIIKIFYNEEIEWKFYTEHCHEKQVEIITEGSATLEFIELRGSICLNKIRLTEIDSFDVCVG